MEKYTPEIEKIIYERFGKDSLFALATVEDNNPYVRTVDTYYENGCFYVITYALSNKMRQISKGSNIALAGDWFTAEGKGINLGWFKLPENKEISEKLRNAFIAWIDNGHNNFDDENTIILCIKLKHAIFYTTEKRFDVDFE